MKPTEPAAAPPACEQTRFEDLREACKDVNGWSDESLRTFRKGFEKQAASGKDSDIVWTIVVSLIDEILRQRRAFADRVNAPTVSQLREAVESFRNEETCERAKSEDAKLSKTLQTYARGKVFAYEIARARIQKLLGDW